MSELVVDIRNLSRQFGRITALDNVSFQASKGRVYGLVGANGAGKTTLIKHMMGLLRCKSGSVNVLGLSPVHNPVQVLGEIGYLSEERDLPDWMSIQELMDYSHAFYTNWDPQYAHELLNSFELDAGQLIKNLSRGMRAQVALIAAVAHRPQLLILDEPSSGLDAIVRKDILNAVVRTISEEGRTVIFSSHFLDEVQRMSDHVTMIQQGRIALEGNLDALTNSHQCSSIQFSDAQISIPHIDGTLRIEGAGRSWRVIHNNTPEIFKQSLQQKGGELVNSRNATLEEIFVACAGRTNDHATPKTIEAITE